jgi:hypothetical protein
LSAHPRQKRWTGLRRWPQGQKATIIESKDILALCDRFKPYLIPLDG